MSQSALEAWRGIAAEEADEVTPGLSSFLRRRSRRLLGDLLRPHRTRIMTILLLIVAANVALLAGPWLVGRGIDQIPAMTATGDDRPLVVIIVAFAVAVGVQAVSTRAYLTGIGAARLLGPKLSSFLGLTEVLFAVLFAWALLGQVPSALQLLGGAFIIAGVALVRLDERADPSGREPSSDTPAAAATV